MGYMNWMEMISVHVMWKQRLSACLARTRAEKPDPEVIRLDHRCPPGQWFDGEGKPMQNIPAYDAVRELHARFHQHAAGLVMLHQPETPHRIPGLSYQVNAATSGVFPS